jgi:hypothetical protein
MKLPTEVNNVTFEVILGLFETLRHITFLSNAGVGTTITKLNPQGDPPENSVQHSYSLFQPKGRLRITGLNANKTDVMDLKKLIICHHLTLLIKNIYCTV